VLRASVDGVSFVDGRSELTIYLCVRSVVHNDSCRIGVFEPACRQVAARYAAEDVAVVAMLAAATALNVGNGAIDVGVCHNAASNFGTCRDRNLAQQSGCDGLRVPPIGHGCGA
jgi:hypothetical protein